MEYLYHCLFYSYANIMMLKRKKKRKEMSDVCLNFLSAACQTYQIHVELVHLFFFFATHENQIISLDSITSFIR